MSIMKKEVDQLYFTKDHEMVRRAVREFVDKEINPYMDEWEEKGQAPLHDLFKKMGDLGFLGIRYDPKYGGEGLDQVGQGGGQTVLRLHHDQRASRSVHRAGEEHEAVYPFTANLSVPGSSWLCRCDQVFAGHTTTQGQST